MSVSNLTTFQLIVFLFIGCALLFLIFGLKKYPDRIKSCYSGIGRWVKTHQIRAGAWTLLFAGPILLYFALSKYWKPVIGDDFSGILVNLGCDFLASSIFFFLFDIILKDASEQKGESFQEFPHDLFIHDVRNLKLQGTKTHEHELDGDVPHIRILETSSTLLQGKWAASFIDALESALDRGINVQVLLMNPEAQQVQERQLQLDQDKKNSGKVDLEADIHENIGYLIPLLNKYSSSTFSRRQSDSSTSGRGKLDVKLWEKNFSLSLNICSPYMYIGRYGIGESRKSTQLLIHESSDFTDFFNDMFKEYWDDNNSTGLDSTLTLNFQYALHKDPTYYRLLDEPCMFIKIQTKYFIYSDSLRNRIERIKSDFGISSLEQIYFKFDHGNPITYRITLCPYDELVRLRKLFGGKYQKKNIETVYVLSPIDREENTDGQTNASVEQQSSVADKHFFLRWPRITFRGTKGRKKD